MPFLNVLTDLVLIVSPSGSGCPTPDGIAKLPPPDWVILIALPLLVEIPPPDQEKFPETASAPGPNNAPLDSGSEERRVGEECRSRWSPYDLKETLEQYLIVW